MKSTGEIQKMNAYITGGVAVGVAGVGTNYATGDPFIGMALSLGTLVATSVVMRMMER